VPDDLKACGAGRTGSFRPNCRNQIDGKDCLVRAANIISAIVMLLWLGLALTGRVRLQPFLVDEVADWPSMTSIDSSILFPILMATALLAFAYVCNASRRRPFALLAASFAWFIAILPYLAITGGGV
jgi:hypothetical protein